MVNERIMYISNVKVLILTACHAADFQVMTNHILCLARNCTDNVSKLFTLYTLNVRSHFTNCCKCIFQHLGSIRYRFTPHSMCIITWCHSAPPESCSDQATSFPAPSHRWTRMPATTTASDAWTTGYPCLGNRTSANTVTPTTPWSVVSAAWWTNDACSTRAYRASRNSVRKQTNRRSSMSRATVSLVGLLS